MLPRQQSLHDRIQSDDWCRGLSDGLYADPLANPSCSVYFRCSNQALAALHRCPPHTLFLEAGLWNGGKGEEEAGSEGACIPEEEFLHNAHLRKLGASSSGEGWEGFPVEGQGDAGSAYPSGGHRGVSLREVAGVSRAVGLLESKPAAAAAAGAGGAEIAGGAGGDEGAGGTGESMGAMRSQLEVNPQAGGSGASSPGASSQAAPSSPTPSASLPDPQTLAELNALLAFKASVIVFNDLLASWTVPRSAFSASSAPSANSVPSASPASSAASSPTPTASSAPGASLLAPPPAQVARGGWWG
ncbi:unnamed protein product [Closterium sp. NIES-65]|nr:unnamed protein product [Closterium sp. NIES-65]